MATGSRIREHGAKQNAKLVSGRFVLRELFLERGIWYCRIRDLRHAKLLKRSTGERRRDRADQRALDLIKELEAREEEGVLKGRRFDAAFEEWLALKDVRPATLEAYRFDFKGVYKPAFGEEYADDITFADIGRFLKGLADRGLSVRSRQKHLIQLRGFWRWAIRMEYAARNPCEGHKVGRLKMRSGVALTFDDARLLLRACRDRPVRTVKDWRRGEWRQSYPAPGHLETAVAIALYTGLRRRNVTGLRWDQVDLVERRISIPGDEMKAGNDHQVPIHPALVRLLNAELRGREAAPSDGELILQWREQPIDRLSASFKAALRRAGLPVIRFHDLRHTFSTWMEERVSFAGLKRLMGHAAADVTLRYTHPDFVKLRNAVDTLPDLLAGDAASKAAEERHG